jgi:hypothetical protein
MSNYFNIKDFDSITLKTPVKDHHFSNAMDRAAIPEGKQFTYDVFISHSTKNKDVVKKLKQLLEDKYNLSAYIDWDEDAGCKRDEVCDKVKDAMNRSKSLLYIKTSDSDDSQWVAWEVGRYDALNADKIGVLLIEDDKLTNETWLHREFLKHYYILEKDDVVPFVSYGKKRLIEDKATAFKNDFENKNIAIGSGVKLINTVDGTGTTTKFYGDSETESD